MYPEEKEWQAKQDMQILQAAKQIEQDKGRMAAAKEQAEKEMAALKQITGNGNGIQMKQTQSGFNVPQFGSDK